MSNEPGWVKEEYSDNDVIDPGFLLESAIEDGIPCRNLFMQVFERRDPDAITWFSVPPDEWHCLASIFSDRIIMYPVYTNPHTQRYLKPKHGCFNTLIYLDYAGSSLPESAEDARHQIDLRQAWRIFRDDCRYGLGLEEDLEPLWRNLALLGGVDTIVVQKRGASEVIGNKVFLNLDEIDHFRLAFGRIYRNGRDLIRSSKSHIVRNDLLANLNPEKFPRVVRDCEDERLVRVRLDRSGRRNATDRSERKKSVKVVREQLEKIAAEAPADLIQLHAEIERVTLCKMIDKYQNMLGKSTLKENHWQNFFELNIFILTLVFARPVRLLRSQFHAKGSGLDGSGAQVGDFLFAERGQALAIVEIKKPSSQLMLNSTYRNSEVYGPSAELSGAVTQVLYQQSSMQSYWLVHQSRPELKESRPDAIRCVVIAGMTPVDESQRRSFEIFRNACKNVEIITFDELLEKLKLLLNLLTPPETKPVEIPF